jgi:charged multivesicular body protein 4
MWGWFGGGAAQKRKDSPKSAILGLRSQLDMLQKREKYLQSQIDEQDALARKHVNTNKTGTFGVERLNAGGGRCGATTG